jgi:hypothetical protein
LPSGPVNGVRLFLIGITNSLEGCVELFSLQQLVSDRLFMSFFGSLSVAHEMHS